MLDLFFNIKWIKGTYIHTRPMNSLKIDKFANVIHCATKVIVGLRSLFCSALATNHSCFLPPIFNVIVKRIVTGWQIWVNPPGMCWTSTPSFWVSRNTLPNKWQQYESSFRVVYTFDELFENMVLKPAKPAKVLLLNPTRHYLGRHTRSSCISLSLAFETFSPLALKYYKEMKIVLDAVIVTVTKYFYPLSVEVQRLNVIPHNFNSFSGCTKKTITCLINLHDPPINICSSKKLKTYT